MATNFGFNLLSTVQSVIGRQTYQFLEWTGATTNAAGFDVDTYADPVTRYASIQPVSKTRYKDLGLDFTKTYIEILDTETIDLLTRTDNPDQIVFNGFYYEPKDGEDWTVPGGWASIIAVKGEAYDG